MPPKNEPTSSTNDNDISFKPGRFLPSAQLLYRLFFQPQDLLFLRENIWQRPFRMISIMCVLAGIFIGFSRAPHIVQTARDWGTWLGDTVEVLHLREDRISWQQPRNLPYSTWHDDWLISFHGESSSFDVDQVKERDSEGKGVWVSPSAVYAWWMTANGTIRPFTLFKNGKVRGVIKAEKLWPEGLTLEGQDFVSFAGRFAYILIPAFMIQEAFLLFLTVIFYTAVFAFIPVVLRNPFWGNRGFGNAFGFYLYAAIPAFLVTTLFRCMDVNGIGMSGMFVICFVAYLFLAFYNMRKEIARHGSDV